MSGFYDQDGRVHAGGCSMPMQMDAVCRNGNEWCRLAAVQSIVTKAKAKDIFHEHFDEDDILSPDSAGRRQHRHLYLSEESTKFPCKKV